MEDKVNHLDQTEQDQQLILLNENVPSLLNSINGQIKMR
jgi:hypothetical protein